MLLTEEEAEATWCPSARVVVDITQSQVGHALTAINRPDAPGELHPAALCIAAKCNHWEFVKPEVEGGPRRGMCGNNVGAVLRHLLADAMKKPK